jgi:hypothetical protein
MADQGRRSYHPVQNKPDEQDEAVTTEITSSKGDMIGSSTSVSKPSEEAGEHDITSDELTIIEPDDKPDSAVQADLAKVQDMQDVLVKASGLAILIPSSDKLAAVLVEVHKAINLLDDLKVHLTTEQAH